MKLLKKQLGQDLNTSTYTGFTLVEIHILGRGRVSEYLLYIAEFLSPDFLVSLTGFPSHVQNP